MTIASPPQVTKSRPRVRRRAWKLRVEQGRLADFLPAQGEWTADDYLWLTRDTNHLIEWADGWIEELPMPTVTNTAAIPMMIPSIVRIARMRCAWMLCHATPKYLMTLMSDLPPTPAVRAGNFAILDNHSVAERDDTFCTVGDPHVMGNDN